ncbi:endonuclease domain-containing protein [Sphingomonas aracearum]|uniref:DUF559 domain-containing protein n=1 Tax=Sphingomonas aracearum TaxID=2283317 RepID=A0A369W4P3_9SPHN|nr:DUF559 domain-containing protein [Sphingomonas aracearum]RDE07021.1 DUF559 domain-containing protein [Sphingomonas aracearum]
MRLYAKQPVGTVPRARQLRQEAPEPERRLLRGLRESLGYLKWRHQAPVGPFYADILCFSEQLIIEVDGDTHVRKELQDESRSAFLAGEGFRVLRFSNEDVMHNLEGVLQAVATTLQGTRKGSAA